MAIIKNIDADLDLLNIIPPFSLRVVGITFGGVAIFPVGSLEGLERILHCVPGMFAFRFQISNVTHRADSDPRRSILRCQIPIAQPLRPVR